MASKLGKTVTEARRDRMLHEFHNSLFALTEQARLKGDLQSAAVLAYVHDRLCVVRSKMDGDTKATKAIDGLAPKPKFRKRAA